MCGSRFLAPPFRNPGTRMEVSGLICPLVVTLRGEKDSWCTLNKSGVDCEVGPEISEKTRYFAPAGN